MALLASERHGVLAPLPPACATKGLSTHPLLWLAGPRRQAPVGTNPGPTGSPAHRTGLDYLTGSELSVLPQAHEAASPLTPTATLTMSLCQSHQYQLARPIKNPFMRERSRLLSSWKKQAEQGELNFHQARISELNSLPVQIEGCLRLSHRSTAPSSKKSNPQG